MSIKDALRKVGKGEREKTNKMEIVPNKSRLRMEIKEISSEGTFEGMLSPYGNIDEGNDVVEKGAYERTLKSRGNVVPLLWQHKAEFPIGVLNLQDRDDGLWCKGKLQLDLPKAKEAYICLKNRIIKGLSIGFETVKDKIQDGVRHLEEIKLYEGSIVTFPMNEMAIVGSIKGSEEIKGDFLEEFEEIQTLGAFWQINQALDNALRSLAYSDLEKDEKIKNADAIVQQFAETFSEFFPKYLDALEESYGPSETWSREIIEAKAKGKTKKVDGVDLTAGCFAYVGDKDDTSTWKLPIRFPGDDEKTKSHIRNALARFSQTQGIPESERPKVLAKIKAAAKKHGIEVSDDGKSLEGLEEKTGAMISAANKKAIESACNGINEHVKSLLALLEDKSGADRATTLSTEPAEIKSDPGDPHSAADLSEAEMLEQLRRIVAA